MDIVFADKGLAMIELEDAHKHLRKFPVSVVMSAKRKIAFIRSATCERDILNWKSLKYEKLGGDLTGYESIRLNRQWRMLVNLDLENNPPKMTIHSIVDYH